MGCFQKETKEIDLKLPIIYPDLFDHNSNNRHTPKLVQCHVYLIWATYITLILFLGALILGAYLWVDDDQPVKLQIAALEGGSNLLQNNGQNSTRNTSYLLLAKLSRVSVSCQSDDVGIDYTHLYLFLTLVFLFTFLLVCLPVVTHLLARHVEEEPKTHSSFGPVKTLPECICDIVQQSESSKHFIPLVPHFQSKDGLAK